ncbi:TonB-dependent receptor plug domain-containing protein [Sphingomonas sp. ASV193]|uniref:TonB-dependent receptor plug domain-containing protein n=1 Tax=Sphingomonas sp. ASV193 TaxID=3144405 RepID=UPI0032E9210F
MPASAETAPVEKHVFTPADFARFAPKTAYDMITELPGFSLQQASSDRGLGQASENVLIDGQRVANKSGGAIADLKNVPAASVVRIEIVDAASLGIAGLSGQVANVIVRKSGGAHGQVEYRVDLRPYYAHPNLYRGSASVTKTFGPVEATLSVNSQANRGAFGGPGDNIYDADGQLVEARTLRLYSDNDHPVFTGKFKIDGPGSSVGNFSAAYTPFWTVFGLNERRIRSDGDNRTRDTHETVKGYAVDFNGDYEFALGPGRLKLIGVRHFEHDPDLTVQRTRFDSGAPDQGIRFFSDGRSSETVARAEYGWATGPNHWLVTAERAVNTLDLTGTLDTLAPDGTFTPVAYAAGSGRVNEHRYEATATLSRALSNKLDLQLVAGAEVSRLARLDGDLPARHFFRPKGSISLAWRPAKGWDAALKVSRQVGQIRFGDFLASPNLTADRENAGNPDLVPPQTWEIAGEAGRDLGRWGKTRLKLFYDRIDDIVDIIPTPDGGQAIGNLPRASRYGAETISTFQLDPAGWRGAKVDVDISWSHSRVEDPLTHQMRPISGDNHWSGSVSLRHDVPHSKIAWGAEVDFQKAYPYYYLNEVGNEWEGPVFTSLFVEHKDLLGFTVRADVINVLAPGRHFFNRTVYQGYRDRSPIAFIERENVKIGPIFRLDLKRSF